MRRLPSTSAASETASPSERCHAAETAISSCLPSERSLLRRPTNTDGVLQATADALIAGGCYDSQAASDIQAETGTDYLVVQGCDTQQASTPNTPDSQSGTSTQGSGVRVPSKSPISRGFTYALRVASDPFSRAGGGRCCIQQQHHTRIPACIQWPGLVPRACPHPCGRCSRRSMLQS